MTPQWLEKMEYMIFRDPNSGCWLWGGYIDREGYGRVRIEKRSTSAHRAVFIAAGQKIPDGLALDHLCRVKCCVNPQHLEPVTWRENTIRWARLITHCPRGHEYDAANTYRNGTRRICRKCACIHSAQYRNRVAA